MDAKTLEQKIKDKDGLVLIDVRSSWEFASGHVESAHNVPYWRIFRARTLIRESEPGTIVLYCEHGPRAWFSGALLRIAGIKNIDFLEGHMLRWKKEGRALQRY